MHGGDIAKAIFDSDSGKAERKVTAGHGNTVVPCLAPFPLPRTHRIKQPRSPPPRASWQRLSVAL